MDGLSGKGQVRWTLSLQKGVGLGTRGSSWDVFKRPESCEVMETLLPPSPAVWSRNNVMRNGDGGEPPAVAPQLCNRSSSHLHHGSAARFLDPIAECRGSPGTLLLRIPAVRGAGTLWVTPPAGAWASGHRSISLMLVAAPPARGAESWRGDLEVPSGIVHGFILLRVVPRSLPCTLSPIWTWKALVLLLLQCWFEARAF